MNKTIGCFLVFVSLSCILFASKIDTLEIYSDSMKKNIKNLVITPDSYSGKADSYSVVYLLHGAGGNFKDCLKKMPDIKKYADDYNVIIVCPDGAKTSWYFDSPIDAAMKYETYVSKELVSVIDKSYKTFANKENRAICGLSMGGHGALFLAFKHSDVFGVAGSMSGGVDIRPFPLRWSIAKRLGSYSENPENWENNTVINLVHLLNGKNLKIIFDCGVDDFFYDANVRLHKKLLERNIPHDYIERPGGHTNKYWENSIKYQMVFFNDFFKN
ncbi:alpha/beta hydrolase family protein [Polaribacter vadi]|uniref:alpha/beta hydrolase n=1 Tax=Polaribacter vadi TaxID=1774273 RepID=UPI0030EDDEC6|tara:strand:+ start:20389 stop:21204 length:816 start_codon:yes stop_codon:yes gene_type:complete